MRPVRILYCAVLLGLAAPAPAVDCEASYAACHELAELVAESCPHRCTSKHCTQRCIPPLADDGRCGVCQASCARICDSQSTVRFERCASERRACRDAAPQ